MAQKVKKYMIRIFELKDKKFLKDSFLNKPPKFKEIP